MSPTTETQPLSGRESMSERIYRQLKTDLIIGSYLPGDRISMRKLADSLGTSVMPVREALKRLAAERALESAAQKSFQVPILTPERTANLFMLRSLLESAAIEEAIAHLGDADFLELRLLNNAMDRHVASHQFNGYLEANYRFHFLLYAASRNEELVELIEQLWARTGPSLHQGLLTAIAQQDHIPSDATEGWNVHHIPLLDALQHRDTVRATDLIRQDIDWGIRLYGKG